ncbi:MAG: glycoside hydrolase family 57 protein [Calditrichia bacterium]
MSENTLRIAFLWHFHQPNYKNARGFYHLPWLRFHATKDYLNFALLFKSFPKLKQNVNIVPSLLIQLEDYIQNNARDNIWLLSEKPADELDAATRQSILEHFFVADEERMIRPYPRYHALYRRYAEELSQLEPRERVIHFDTQDYLDLQIWYNLIWFGEVVRERPGIAGLFDKAQRFSEKDKDILFTETVAVLSEVTDAFRELWESGQIELSTSPLFHPVLPLLIDNTIALETNQDIVLPKTPQRLPDDAENQLVEGMAKFTDVFGAAPAGIWPPEGGVSAEAMRMIALQNVRWSATDEIILKRSLDVKRLGSQLYQPHRYKAGGREISMFFRDHYLSDTIGYVYCNWDSARAVNDFISRLRHIRNLILAEKGGKKLKDHLVTIILDGENSWEHYPENGHRFLTELFTRLSTESELETICFSDFLDSEPVLPELPELKPGSWIYASFDYWIGTPEENKALELLTQTRQFLKETEERGVIPANDLAAAWRHIHSAQGSDWCWWYGDDKASFQALAFDQLFREQLMCVYELCNGEAPTELFQPIKRTQHDEFNLVGTRQPISPVIGEATAKDWEGAAVYDCSRDAHDAMRRTARILERLYIGFDDEMLYLRVDFSRKLELLFEFVLGIKMPSKITLVLSPLRGVVERFETIGKVKQKTVLAPRFSVGDSFEAAIALKDIGLQPGEPFGFQFLVKLNRQHIEVFPQNKLLELELPL